MRSSASTPIRAAPEARPPMRVVCATLGRALGYSRPTAHVKLPPLSAPPQVAEVQVAHCFARCFARLRLTAADSIARRCLEPLPKRHRDLSPGGHLFSLSFPYHCIGKGNFFLDSRLGIPYVLAA
jgi:hypothetical protein